jgi:cell division protein DivIC
MKLFHTIPSWIKSKYFLTATGFVVWMLFFDDQDIITTHFRHRSELNRLQDSRAYYQQSIESIRKELEELKSDPAVLEKYAREKYRMKKANEDIFIISGHEK